MSISVDWDDSQQMTIRYNIRGEWTWLEFEGALQQSIIMTYTQDHAVHEIFDLSYSQPFPDDGLLFWRNVIRVMPENRGYLVFVGGGASVSSLLSVLERNTPAYVGKLHTVGNLQQAHKLITYLQAKDGVA
jgi:hypothetical protein